MNNNEERNRAIDLYHKLHKCLQIALTAPTEPNGGNLSCHANNIILKIADLINSDYMFCNRSADSWADYFLSMNKGKGYTAEEIESMRLTVCDLEAQLEQINNHTEALIENLTPEQLKAAYSKQQEIWDIQNVKNAFENEFEYYEDEYDFNADTLTEEDFTEMAQIFRANRDAGTETTYNEEIESAINEVLMRKYKTYDRYYVTVTHNFSRTFEVMGRTREEALEEAEKTYALCTSGTYDMCEGGETWDWEVTADDPMQVIKKFDN